MNSYHLIRKFFKLPRPNEVWQSAENRWDIWNILLYIKFAIGHLSSWVGFLFGLIQTVLLLGIVTKQTDPVILAVVIGLGAFCMFVGGHILIVLGSMRRENNIAAGQNEPVIELLKNTNEIRDSVRILINDKQNNQK